MTDHNNCHFVDSCVSVGINSIAVLNRSTKFLFMWKSCCNWDSPFNVVFLIIGIQVKIPNPIIIAIIFNFYMF